MSGCRGTAANWSPSCALPARRWSPDRNRSLALAIVVAIAVLREGSEVVLFLYGVAAAQGGASWSMVAGGFVGLILGSAVCLLTYLGLITIPARYLFSVTSALIALLAAGMAAQAIAFLEQANILTALDETVWDTSWLVSNSSFLGRALHTLIGYVDQPTAMQVVVYAVTLGTIIVLMKLFSTPMAAASAHGVILGSRRPRRGMVGAQGCCGHFAKIGEFGFQAFNVEANDAAARKDQRHDSGGGIVFDEFHGKQIEPAHPCWFDRCCGICRQERDRSATPCGNAGNPPCVSACALIQSKRLTATTKRCSRGMPENIADPDELRPARAPIRPRCRPYRERRVLVLPCRQTCATVPVSAFKVRKTVGGPQALRNVKPR